MQLQFNARLELSELDTLLTRRGLTPGGGVQKVVDSAVLRYCAPKGQCHHGQRRGRWPAGLRHALRPPPVLPPRV